MRDLIAKLESLHDSNEREKIVQNLRDAQKEQDAMLLGDSEDGDGWDRPEYSEADMIKHEIHYIQTLMLSLNKIKDKEVKDALTKDLERSLEWRKDRLLGKTHEFKLNVITTEPYSEEDLYRAENRWIECFNNLPEKICNELKEREAQVEEMQEAEVQEQIDALSSLETEGL